LGYYEPVHFFATEMSSLLFLSIFSLPNKQKNKKAIINEVIDFTGEVAPLPVQD